MIAVADDSCKDCLDIAFGACMQDMELQPRVRAAPLP